MLKALEGVLYPVVVNINNYLSSYILVFLLIAVGLWYSVKTRFVQVRCFGEGMRKVFGNLSLRGGKQEQGMSSFQALATAIAAQVGTGNIVGASGAILRRPRRHFLDVDHCLLRYGHHLCRGYSGAEDPCGG